MKRKQLRPVFEHGSPIPFNTMITVTLSAPVSQCVDLLTRSKYKQCIKRSFYMNASWFSKHFLTYYVLDIVWNAIMSQKSIWLNPVKIFQGRVLVMYQLTCWTVTSKLASSNSSRAIMFTIGLIPKGKIWIP